MILLICGKDISTKAGVDADYRALSGFEGIVSDVITGYYNPQAIDSEKQFTEVRFEDFKRDLLLKITLNKIKVVKVGALFSISQIKLVYEVLKKKKVECGIEIVFDPILSASQGGDFCEDPERDAYFRKIAKISSIFTPNIPEFERLYGCEARELNSFFIKKNRLTAVLLKGGHCEDKEDLFADGENRCHIYSNRFPVEFRGTGCFLASQISRHLYCDENTTKDAVIRGLWEFNSAFAESNLLKTAVLTNAKTLISDLFPRVRLDGFDRDYENSPNFNKTPSNRLYPVVENTNLFNLLIVEEPALIQIRLKGMALKKVKDRLLNIKRIDNQTTTILNDYDRLIDWGSFDGIHLGQDDLLSADIDKLKENNKILGISTHSYFELAVALHFRPTYLALGPIYDTTCKAMIFGSQGIDKITEWKKIIKDLPLVAIGGLNRNRAEKCIEAGADLVAVQSDITQNGTPKKRIQEYLDSSILALS